MILENLRFHFGFSMMIRCAIGPQVLELLSTFSAVGLVGPRQAGKTTLVKTQHFASLENLVVLDLEDPRDRIHIERSD